MFDYKKLKLTDNYDRTSDEEEDANLKLDKETKEFINEIKEKEKPVDRNGFCGYFGYEPSALVSNLLNQKKLG